MSYHRDKEVNTALIRLMDALCQHERNSGRRSYLFLVTEQPDEKNLIAFDGKPVPEAGTNIEQFFSIAVNERAARTATVRRDGTHGST